MEVPLVSSICYSLNFTYQKARFSANNNIAETEYCIEMDDIIRSVSPEARAVYA